MIHPVGSNHSQKRKQSKEHKKKNKGTKEKVTSKMILHKISKISKKQIGE